MIELKLISWEKGLQTISLILAVHEHADTSLARAKVLVENFVGGEVITLQFYNRTRMETFRDIAAKLGVKTECGAG